MTAADTQRTDPAWLDDPVPLISTIAVPTPFRFRVADREWRGSQVVGRFARHPEIGVVKVVDVHGSRISVEPYDLHGRGDKTATIVPTADLDGCAGG